MPKPPRVAVMLDLEWPYKRHAGIFAGTQQYAQQQGWEFEKIAGDTGLFRELVDGPWAEERFLVLQPGQRIVSSFDDRIIRAEPPS